MSSNGLQQGGAAAPGPTESASLEADAAAKQRRQHNAAV